MDTYYIIIYDYRKQLISPNRTKERERKWLHMIANWDREMTKNFKKVITIKINCLF